MLLTKDRLLSSTVQKLRCLNDFDFPAIMGCIHVLYTYVDKTVFVREEHKELHLQIEQLKGKKEQLSVQLREKDRQQRQREAQIEELRQQNEEKNKQVMETREHNEETQEQIRQLRRGDFELRQQIEQQLRHIASLQQKADLLGQTVTHQQTQLHDKQQAIAAVTSEKEEQSRQLGKENAELKLGTARLRQQNEKQSTRIQSLEREVADFGRTVTSQQTQLLQAQEAIDTLTAETKEQIRRLSRENTDLKHQHEEQLTHTQLLQKEAGAFGQTVTLQQTQLRDKQQAIVAVIAEKEKETGQLSKVNTELSQLNEKQFIRILSLQREVANFRRTVTSQQTQLHQTQEAIDALTAETREQIGRLSTENADLKQENDKQLTHIQSLQGEAGGLRQTVTLQQAQLRDKQQTIDAVIAEKEEETDKLSKENAELKLGNAELSQQNEKQSTRIQSLEPEIADFGRTVTSQQTQLLQMQEAIDTITAETEEQIRRLSTENADLKQQNEDQLTHIAHQRTQLRDKQQAIDAVIADKEEQVRHISKENANLKDDIARLRQQNQEQSTRIQSLEQERAEEGSSKLEREFAESEQLGDGPSGGEQLD